MFSKTIFYVLIISFTLLLQFMNNVQTAIIVGNPLAFAYPCNNSEIVQEIFETNQPPEDENKYKLRIDLSLYEYGPSLTANSKIKMKFDSEANIKLESVPARVSTSEELEFTLNFYKKYNGSVFMTVRGRRGKPVPNIINLLIDEEDVCPDGFKTGIWDNLIIGDVDSGVVKEKQPIEKYACGKKIVSHNELITNGFNTKPGDWPWHAAIYKVRVSESSQAYICGGSLLNPTTVLTAGHCVIEEGVKVNPERLYIVLGKFNLAGGDIGTQEKSVFGIILHADFDPKTLKNDISLLKLGSEAVYNQYVQPICLWERDKVQKSNIYDKDGTIVGWGFTQNAALSRQLLQGTMPVVSDLTCLRSYPTHFDKYLTDYTYCAGFRNGTSVCNGDSGGGMYFSREEDRSKVWFLRGIVSLSVRKANENLCDPDHYVIFTDVARYLDWIDSKIK